MNIFSQASLFLSDKAENRKKLIDHYKANYSTAIRAKAIRNLKIASKVVNVVRKIINAIVWFLTFGIKKEVMGKTVDGKDFTVKLVKLSHSLLTFPEGFARRPIDTIALEKYDDQAICILINDITSDGKKPAIDKLLEMINNPLIDFMRLRDGNKVVEILNKEGNKQVQIDAFNLLMDISWGDLSKIKDSLKDLSTEDQKKLYPHFIDYGYNLKNLKNLSELFPDCKDEILGKMNDVSLISLIIQSNSLDDEQNQIFDRNTIDAEIKKRVIAGNYRLLYPARKVLDDYEIFNKKEVYSDYQDRILSVLKTINFKENLPKFFFTQATLDELKSLLVNMTVFDYPNPLKLEIYKRLKRENKDMWNRLSDELEITRHVDEMCRLTEWYAFDLKEIIKRAFREFYEMAESVDQADLDELLLLFKGNNQSLFFKQLDVIMEKYVISNELKFHINQSYEYYFVIKRRKDEIISAWEAQPIKGLWFLNEINYPIHFENYLSKNHLVEALNSFLGGLEQILSTGIDKNDLYNAFTKGFKANTNCLEARTENMNAYLVIEIGDLDYMAAFEKKHNLAANLGNYFSVYQKISARRFVKENVDKYPGVDFNSNEWKGDGKLRKQIIDSNEDFFQQYMTKDKFKAFLRKKEFFEKFLEVDGIQKQIAENDVDMEVNAWIDLGLLAK